MIIIVHVSKMKKIEKLYNKNFLDVRDQLNPTSTTASTEGTSRTPISYTDETTPKDEANPPSGE
jgi:hypothetical protein